MTDLEEKILSLITNSSGLKASQIAKELNIERKAVNSILYNSAKLKPLIEQNSQTYCWSLKNTTINGENDNSSDENNSDVELKNICNYYLNCIAQEASSDVSQYLKSYNDLNYALMGSLDLNENCNMDARKLLAKLAKEKNVKTYLGYPIRIYSFHSNKGSYKRIAPIFLFPVDFNNGDIDISWIPQINMTVLKEFFGKSDDSALNELVNLENDLGMVNTNSDDIDIDELVLRLRNIRAWDWAEEINPYSIPPIANITEYPDGIYNRPILIKADRETYTQGLESELISLSKLREDEYKDTALYSWIKGTSSDFPEYSEKQILEVVPLNTEQYQSIETALSSPLTIVTGPPGTGKSQVVTDLLINIAWNGKSALFSSKNNKAVDVVDIRVNSLSKRPVLLRVGGPQYASRLADIISGMLDSQPNHVDKDDAQFYQSQYDELQKEVQSLCKKKNHIISVQNELDKLEQEYCGFREQFSRIFSQIDLKDIGKIRHNH